MKPSRRCYVLKPLGNDGLIAFVSHPHEAARWSRTHPSVVTTQCPACQAAPGELCKFKDGYTGSTHYMRRKESKKAVGTLQSAVALVLSIERRY